jgi:hypothetical protein
LQEVVDVFSVNVLICFLALRFVREP